jgi:hypothetical protein
MKKNYTFTLEEATWAVLEEIARKRNFVYHGRPSRGMVVEKLVDGYLKKQSGPPKEASARDEVKQPATERKPWTVAAVLAHWPQKERERYRQDEHKYSRVVQLVLDTINEQSP